MTRFTFAILLLVGFVLGSGAQVRLPIDALYGAQDSFCRKAAIDGEKAAFLSVLMDDGVIFRPAVIKGRQFWSAADGPSPLLYRGLSFADVSSNGLLGYTTGSWRSELKTGGKSVEHVGEYVTIWESRNGGDFRAVLDITTRHDDLEATAVNSGGYAATQDSNFRGWSATNDAMRFLRTSMQGGGLAAALTAVTMDDVRLLMDDEQPVIGRKKVLEAARSYTATGFPADLAIYQSGDMAYFWNQCRYQNSSEGIESGNCLQIMKLRDKKWWIVLAVFARLDDARPPVLVTNSPSRK